MLFLLALTESNDIAQYLWGNPAAEEKWSLKSAREKHWKVYGRRHHHHDCVTDYRTVTDTLNTLQALLAGLLIGISGFCGMS